LLGMKSVLKKLLARKILAGPFHGMRYLGTSSGSTLMPKILGTYEQELHPLLARLQPHCQSKVVIVGAAEGYYAVGMLRANPRLEVVAFELSAEARVGLDKLAQVNGVANRLDLREACEPDVLQQVLAVAPVDLVLMDVEGYEEVLLNPVAVPQLKTCSVLVELHDFQGYSMAEKLREPFSGSHVIEHIPCQPRTPDDIQPDLYRLLARCSTSARHALLWERGDEAGWLYLSPKDEA
jgi:hypothetical protein